MLDPAPPTTALFDELSQVREHWRAAGRLAAGTLLKYERVHEDWLGHRPSPSLAAATAADIHSFALSRTRTGSTPAGATSALRMAALDTTYSTAHQLGLTVGDPLARAPRPTRTGQKRAVVSDADRAHLHRLCRATGLVRQPSLIAALAECGVGTAEMGTLTLAAAAGAAPSGHLVLPGTGRRPARTVPVTDFAREVLAGRVSALVARGHGGQYPLTGTATTQEATCMTLRNMVKRDPATSHVTATGLNRWAAREEYRRTGDLRAAAALLGVKDLNAVARYVDV